MKKTKVLKTVCRVCNKVLTHPTLGRLAPAVFDSALPRNDKPSKTITWAWCEKCHAAAVACVERKLREYLEYQNRNSKPEEKPNKVHYFVSHCYGVTCDIRVMDRGNKQVLMQARLRRTPQNPNTEWHDIDIGEMLARTNLELVR